MTDSYHPETPVGQVRLLLNDVELPFVFSDVEVQGFLTLEQQSVKRAAAQAIDTNADSLVLASRVLRTQDVSVDGAKAADSLRKRATELRAQADTEDEGFFTVVEAPRCPAELTEFPAGYQPASVSWTWW